MHPFDKFLKDRIQVVLTGSPSIHGRRIRGAKSAFLPDDYVLKKDLDATSTSLSEELRIQVVTDFADLPSDFDADDIGKAYFVTSEETLYIWDGSDWVSISGGDYYEPMTNGDPVTPELMFDDTGDVIMMKLD